MMITNVLGVAGIAVSAIFGVWGVYLTIKKRKYPSEISYVSESSINLFNDVVGDLNEIKILYQDQPVKHNLVLLKGHLINTGETDISPSMVSRELTAVLPENYKWIEAKVTGYSKEVSSSVQIVKENILSFDLDYFRCKEFVSFQALVEVPIDDEKQNPSSLLKKSIKWDHRIINTEKVKFIASSVIGSSYIFSVPFMILGLVFCLFYAGFEYYSSVSRKPFNQHLIKYQLGVEKNKIFYHLSSNDGEAFKLESDGSVIEEEISRKGLLKKYEIVINLPYSKKRINRGFLYYSEYVLIGLSILILYMTELVIRRKEKYIKSLLKRV